VMVRARAVWVAAGALALMAAVAAAGASSAAPGAGTRGGGSAGLGTPLWAGDLVVGFISAGGVVMLYLTLIEDRSLHRSSRAPWDYGDDKRPWWQWALSMVGIVAFVGLLVGALVRLATRKVGRGVTQAGSGSRAAKTVYAATRATVGSDPIMVGVVGAVLAIIALRIWQRSKNRGKQLGPLLGSGDETDERDEVVGAIDGSLDALMAEPDPRRAVIAAYGRMERWMSYTGYGRRSWEAPFEHLDRVVADLGATAAVGATLAGLFERAKFDNRPCGPEMKQEAIMALTELRKDLAHLPRGDHVGAGAIGGGAAVSRGAARQGEDRP
jgi:Domain of unknown function (DUF4129)